MAQAMLQAGKVIALVIVTLMAIFVGGLAIWVHAELGYSAEQQTGPILGPDFIEDDRPVILSEERYEITERRNTNQRVWEIVREVEVLDSLTAEPRVEEVVSNLVQVGDGICYQDSEGQWQVSDTRWESLPDGFVMDRAGYKLRIGKTLGTWLQYEVDGHSMNLKPSRVVADDGTHSETIGRRNDEAAGLPDPNDPTCLVFADAFGSGIGLSLQARPGGYHQNIIFRKRPTLSEVIDPSNTSIAVYTEMDLQGYARTGSLKAKIGRSDAFALMNFDAVSTSEDGVSDAVNAMAPTLDDITFVAKDTDTNRTTSRLLHRFGKSAVFDSGELAGRKEDVARKQIRHDGDGHTYLIERLDHQFFQTASYPVVWDYSTVYGTLTTDTVWYACNTYFVDPCGLNVTVDNCELKIEPGTIVKMGAYGGTVNVSNGGRIAAKGEPYLPIIFTSAKDDENGESLGPYGLGDPQGGDYNGLVVEDGSQVEYCSFFYAGRAVEVNGKGVIAIQHNRFYWVEQAVKVFDPCEMTAGDSVTIFNNLMIADPCNCSAMIEVDGGSQDGQGIVWIRNNTIHGPYIGIRLYDTSTSICAINNILSGCTTGVVAASISNFSNTYNGYYNNSTDCIPYESKGEGSRTVTSSPFYPGQDFYLDETYGANFSDVGPSSPADAGYTDPSAWSIHYPQHEFNSSTSISSSTEWEPEYDTCDDDNLVDLGYHYPRIDYLIHVASGNVTVSGSGVVLTVQAGTVVAHDVDSSSGAGKLIVEAGGSLVCAGEPFEDGYVTWVNCDRIQWAMAGCVPRSNAQNFIELRSGSDYDMRFTRFLGLGMAVVPSEGSGIIRDSVFMLNTRGVDYQNCDDYNVDNCLFMGNLMGVRAWHDATGYVGSGIIRSCTFDRNLYGVVMPGTAAASLTVRNCLFHSNRKDDGAGHAISFRNTNGSASLVEEHNAFFFNNYKVYNTNTAQEWSHLTDQVLGVDPYDPAWVDFAERFHLAQGGDCIGTGYDPLSAGKPFYTTGLDKRCDVAPVDIGYHYAGVVRFVDGSKTDGDQTGLGWESAYRYLQDALDESGLAGVTAVCVKGGTYYPDEDKDSGHTNNVRGETFSLTDGLAVYGGFSGEENPYDFDLAARDFDTNETILSGDIQQDASDGNNAYHVVTGADGSMLNGLTITKGYAMGSGNDGYGGGLLNLGVSPRVVDCRFLENIGFSGGGVCNYVSSACYSSCEFTGNFVTDYGGGVANLVCNLITFENCLFSGNTAYFYDEDGPVFSGYGGAVYSETSTDTDVVNCTFHDNLALVAGGAVADYASTSSIRNSILWNDSAAFGNELAVMGDASNGYSTTDVYYSDVEGGAAELYGDAGCTVNWTNNIYSNPVFADAANGDFHLKSVVGRWDATANQGLGGWVVDAVHSPCIDGGDSASAYASEPMPNGGQINMGVFGNTVEASKSQRGSVTVTINPAGARTAGAKWKLAIKIGGAWYYYDGIEYSSGDTIDQLEPGEYFVEFTTVSEGLEYVVPDNLFFTVSPAENESLTGTYKEPKWVSTSGSNNNPGTYQSPYRTIQYAIDHKGTDGAIIYVDGNNGQGIYYENVIIDDGDGYFQLEGYEWPTINGGANDSVVFLNEADYRVEIAGFFITNGYAQEGAGMWIYNCSPTVYNCRFYGNRARPTVPGIEWARGGGMSINSGAPVILNCDFVANTAFHGSASSTRTDECDAGSGGGIYTYKCSKDGYVAYFGNCKIGVPVAWRGGTYANYADTWDEGYGDVPVDEMYRAGTNFGTPVFDGCSIRDGEGHWATKGPLISCN